MKKRTSFFAGVVATLLVVTMGTTALAASGQVSFNFANIALNGEMKIAAGKTITAPNGQQVPGSILYTDAAGGKTNYLPIRVVSDLLGVKIDYDSATKTIQLGNQPTSTARKWQREIDGKKVLYFCDEEGHSYSTPLTFRPTWAKDGWGIKAIRHDTCNYTTTWEYQGAEGSFSLECANPSTAGLARQMNSADAIKNCQTLTIQGNAADYYQDGKHSLLVWENRDGILFFISGIDVSRELLTEVAESVKPCTNSVEKYSLGWLPKNYTLMESYEIADTVQEYWVRDGVALSWMYSTGQMQLPTWDSSTVKINGIEARYWEAQEPYSRDAESTSGMLTYSIPSQNEMNTLAWKDPGTGVYYRLQSILDKDTTIHIASKIK